MVQEWYACGSRRRKGENGVTPHFTTNYHHRTGRRNTPDFSHATIPVFTLADCGQKQLQTEPQASSVSYEQQQGRFVIELKSGVTLLLPIHLLQGLVDAPPALLADVQVGPRGASLYWETPGY